MKNDFADCRFTESDETTLIDYGIVDKTDGVSCTFVIERDYTSGCTLTVYLYYGNAGAGDASVDHGPWALAWYLANGFGQNPSAYSDGNCGSYPRSAAEAIPAWADVIFGGCTANGYYRAYYGRVKINGVAAAWASEIVCSGRGDALSLKWNKYHCTSAQYDHGSFVAGASNTVTWGHYSGGNTGFWVSWYPTDPSVSFGDERAWSETEDLYAKFIVKQWQEDLLGEFVIRRSSSLDLPVSFEGQTTIDLLGEFFIINIGAANLPAEFEVGQGSEDLAGSFDGQTSLDFFAEFDVRQPAFGGLFGEFDVRQEMAVNLYAGFQAGMPFLDLFAEYVIRRSGPVPWLAGWRYRKTHTLTGSTAGARTNYQTGVKVYYGAGADGTEVIGGITFGKVYCNSKCKTDFSDIHFTNGDGITLLDYWLQEKIDSDYAIFWVEVDSIPASPSTVDIYIYYGNPSATYTDAQQHGKDTFIIFDDFPGVALDGQWTVDANITVTVAGGTLTCKATANSWSTWHGIHMALANVQGIRLESYTVNWAHLTNDLYQFGSMLGVDWANQTLGHRISDPYASTPEGYLTYIHDDAGLSKGDIEGEKPVDLVEQRDQNGAVKFFKDGVEQQVGGETSTDSFDTLMILCNRLTTYVCPNLYLDRILARSYVDPEPAHTAWGPEAEATLFAQFSVRQEASADLLAGFTVSQSSEDLLGEFSVRQETSVELFAIFDVSGFTDASVELLGEFSVRQEDAVDLLCAFAVRHDGVPVELLGEFKVGQTGTPVNLLGIFDVQRKGSGELLSGFSVRHIGTPVSLRAEFIVRHSASVELLASFEGQTSVRLLGELSVRQEVSADLLAEFIVRHIGSVELLGEFSVRRTATEDLLGTFDVRQETSEDLLGEFIVRHDGLADLLGEFVIRRAAIRDLPAEFEVGQGAESLPGEFIIRHSATLDLAAGFTVRHTATTDVAAEVIVQCAATADLPASIWVNYYVLNLLAGFNVRQTSSRATDFTIIDNTRGLTIHDADREMTVTPKRRMRVK